MAIYRDEVAVLKSRELGDFDKILVMFGKRRGKFSAVAKGIRRLTSRKRGHLETFNLCKVSCAEGKNLDVITEAEAYVIVDPDNLDSAEYDALGFAGLVLDTFFAGGSW